MHILSGEAGQTRLLLGNEAIARGALEAGATFFSCYPGTPSSEIMDALASARESIERDEGIAAPFYAEYSVNEKVALEAAAGAALGGARSMVCMKHVGLNVAADPLFTAAYIGLPGGLVILSADDPGCHSSQNEQDNRHYARAARLPCLEPASPSEALEMTREAFRIARELQQPALLRTTTRINHMRGAARLSEIPAPATDEFRRDPGRFVPVPMVARKRHLALDAQMRKAAAISENSVHNRAFYPLGDAKHEFGVAASGASRNYLRDALRLSGLENEIAVLELGMTWPLPVGKISEFLRRCEKVLVLEEGEPLLERDILALAHETGSAAKIFGKDAKLTCQSEFSTALVRNRLLRWMGKGEISAPPSTGKKLPGRPPNLCPGCAHRTIYYAARKVFGDDAYYSNDIGCYTLGMLPPLKAADFMICMGSSVTAGSGFAKASKKPVVAFIGDSTFFHSGMTGLLNAVFNRHDLLLVIMDNGSTAMTGHQPNPGVVQEALGERSEHMDIESVVRGLGVKNCEKVRGGRVRELIDAMRRLKDAPGARVLIAEEPCVLFARKTLKKRRNVVATVKKQGEEADQCMRDLACPAFYRKNGELRIDKNLCSGCLVCAQIAPKNFQAVKAE